MVGLYAFLGYLLKQFPLALGKPLGGFYDDPNESIAATATLEVGKSVIPQP